MMVSMAAINESLNGILKTIKTVITMSMSCSKAMIAVVPAEIPPIFLKRNPT